MGRGTNNNKYNSSGSKEPTDAEDYSNIESCLKAYTSDYSDSGYSDTNSNFTAKYQKMLKSIYENGGFWIGRYEAGLESGKKPRTTHTDIAEDDKAVIKQNTIPYNYVTRDEAQLLATKMGYNDCTSSLIFGIQWDLLLKYIETKNITVQEILTKNSTTVGNYYNSELVLNRGKFAKHGELSKWYDFNSEEKSNLVTSSKKQAQSSYENGILLTTGATDETKLQNIYDIAGNVWEWTLELCNDTFPCVSRGGNFSGDGSGAIAKSRYYDKENKCYGDIGFRIGLWK